MPVIIVIIIAIGYVLVQYILVNKKVTVGLSLVQQTVAYTQAGAENGKTVLVVGDSTGVGVGAATPAESVAGLIGADFPDASIENRAVSGAKVHDLLDVFNQLSNERAHFDVVVIQIGGNDIVRFTPLKSAEQDLAQVLEQAKHVADNVVVFSCGNVGTAPFFPFGTRWAWGVRTRAVRQIFLRQTAATQVQYIDLYREKKDDPFAQDPKRYYAADSFHPSSDGYAAWYTSISPVVHSMNIGF
ncbi:MAG: GDSL family lipase [Candidatus Kerfeldbacteria bacterium]|nr:GDSL family lipase [Candidatus Kerfeldbacteria bacterium]